MNELNKRTCLKTLTILGLLVTLPLSSVSAKTVSGVLPAISISYDEEIIYKQVQDIELKLRIWHPKTHPDCRTKAAIVFYHGGSWKRGTMKAFAPQASYFANLGITTITVEYRVADRHGTEPFIALMDAKSAMRWIRKEVQSLSIDSNKIIAAGGSAGAHLAAAMTVIDDFNDPQDDVSISTVPSALLLFNPVIDNGPNGYGFNRVKDYWQRFSPLHNITTTHPPTLVMLGSKDELIPVSTGELYIEKIKATKAIAKLVVYPHETHGFFNKSKFKETLLDVHEFLYELGYLKIPPPERLEHLTLDRNVCMSDTKTSTPTNDKKPVSSR